MCQEAFILGWIFLYRSWYEVNGKFINLKLLPIYNRLNIHFQNLSLSLEAEFLTNDVALAAKTGTNLAAEGTDQVVGHAQEVNVLYDPSQRGVGVARGDGRRSGHLVIN